MTTLGKLERVDVRTAWANEAGDFTPWLATPENLQILGDTLGIELELEAQETQVGPFRADILCKDTATGDWVLIENQLERTDHIHLGQLITYAAGLHAATIVWVSTRFVDEHQAALDWLNEITDDHFRFFGLEVELWRIGDSLPAPKFNVKSQPNEWSRTVGQATRSGSVENLSDVRALQLRFWEGFREHLLANVPEVRPQKPFPENWTQFALGRTGFVLVATIKLKDRRVSVEFFIQTDEAKACFDLLEAEKDHIEANLGALSWERLEGRKGVRIAAYKDDLDLEDEGEWPVVFEWMGNRLQAFNAEFRPRVRTLDAAATPPDNVNVAE